MSFINWSDPEEMLSLLLEYVEGEWSESHADPRRRQWLSTLLEDLSELERRFSALAAGGRLAALHETSTAIDAEFASDPVAEHLAHCAEEIDRINREQAAAPDRER
jgi:hypothetical protein